MIKKIDQDKDLKETKSYPIENDIYWFHKDFYIDVKGKMFKKGEQIDENCILGETNIDNNYIHSKKLVMND